MGNKIHEEEEKEKEMITIPKSEYDNLKKEIGSLTKRISDVKIKLDRYGGVFLQIQTDLYNTKNSI